MIGDQENNKTQLVEELLQEAQTIARIGRIINSSLNIEQVYERFAGEVRKLIPFDRLAINIVRPEEETVAVAYVSGVEVEGRKIGDTFPLDGSIQEKMMQTRSGVIVHVSSLEKAREQFPAVVLNFNAGSFSMLSAPLISREQIIGALHFRSRTPYAYGNRQLELAERIADQIAGALAISQLFLKWKRSAEELSRRESDLALKTRGLEEMNAALKVLLQQREKDKAEVEEKILTNLKELVFPYLDKLRGAGLNEVQAGHLHSVEESLKDVISPFLHSLAPHYANLTRREIQIASLIKAGKTSKEISSLLEISSRAIDFHRNNIRKKLGLKDKKTSLHSFLSNLTR